MKALPLAIALSLVCSAASAQTAVSTTTVRVTKDRAVATELGRQPHDDGPPQQRRREHHVHDHAHAVADLSLSGAADHA